MYKDKHDLLYNFFFVKILQSVYLHQGNIIFQHNIKIYMYIQKAHKCNFKHTESTYW